jgi:alpha-1,2-mannosyltransferase
MLRSGAWPSRRRTLWRPVALDAERSIDAAAEVLTIVPAARGQASSRGALARAMRALLPVGAVLALIALVYLPRIPHLDLDVFLRAGASLLDHKAVYPASGTPAVYSGSAFVYPVAAAWPFVPLSLLPHWLAVGVWEALSLAAIIVACWVGSDRPAPTAVCVLLCSFTIIGLQVGALSPLLFAGLVFAWRLRDQPLAFGLVAGPLIAVKLFLLPILIWPLLTRRWRAAACAAAVSLGLLAVGFAAGPIGPREYLRLLTDLAAHESERGLGLISGIQAFGLSGLTSQGTAAGVAVGVVALTVRACRQAGRDNALFTAGVVVALLLTPVLWSHYLLLLAAPLMARRASVLAFAVFAAASWLIVVPHKSDALSMAVGIVALALALTLGLRGRSVRLRAALSGPSGGKALVAAVLGLLVIAALVALAGLPAGQAVNLRAWFGVALLVTVTITGFPVAGRPWLGSIKPP